MIIDSLQTRKQDKSGLRLDLFNRDRIEPFLVAVTLGALLMSLTAERAGASETFILVLNIISYLAGGFYATWAGLAKLTIGEIDVDLLMVAAAVGAATVNQWHEGAILLFLFSLSNVLQAYAIGRSRNAIKSLLDLRPDEAIIRRDGRLLTVAVEELILGDVVVVRPGDRIAVDGRVTSGSSTVNQAAITGESMPVSKENGDIVFAGTVNQNGTMDVEVTKLASESTLARIITMVEEAQDRHSTTQRRLDRFEQRYAKAIIGFVTLMVVVPPLLFKANFNDNFYRSMVLLVVASPCALVISTPASILSAIANAARQGILFKGGAHLEDMAAVKVVAFDKTGTITTGEPSVTDLIPQPGATQQQLLSTLACAESPSEHPIARAIVNRAAAEGLEICEPEEFQAQPGRGVMAVLNGQRILIGTERLMAEYDLEVPADLSATQRALENSGKTTLLVRSGDTWLGVVAVADQVRANAAEAVRQLRRAGVEHVVMLTGDKESIAERIAKEVGVTEFHSELLPAQKVERLEALQKEYGAVAMVGDGVNDAPALATASVGVAMGAAGTDVALETADVVLMADDLSKIAYAISLSKKARRIVYQNLAFSMSVIVVLAIATLIPFIHVPLPLGVVGHEGSTIIVVSNGLRLLVWRWR